MIYILVAAACFLLWLFPGVRCALTHPFHCIYYGVKDGYNYIRYKKHLEIKDARRAPRPIYKSAGIGNAALAVWGACIYGPPDVPYMKLMRFQSSLIQGVEIMERATL